MSRITILFFSLFLSPVVLGIDFCGGATAAWKNGLPPWEYVKRRLTQEGVLVPVDLAFDSYLFGLAAAGTVGAIPAGALTQTQFETALEEVREVVPGLIYTQLVFKWAQRIEADYGPRQGQVFALFLLNPQQGAPLSLEDTIGMDIGLSIFRQAPTLIDLAQVRKAYRPKSFSDWEFWCWKNVELGLAAFAHGLNGRERAFERVDRLLKYHLHPRFVMSFADKRGRREYSIPVIIEGVRQDALGRGHEFRRQVFPHVVVHETSEETPQRWFLLDIWNYGTRDRILDEHLALRAEMDGAALGAALNIRPHIARDMLADLMAVQAAVKDAFPQ